MKRLIFIFLLAFTCILIDANAQTRVTDSTGLVSSGNMYLYQSYTAGTLRGTDSVKSVSFSRYDFDSTISIYGLFSSATDSAKVTVILQHSPDYTHWATLRTWIAAADTTTLYYKEDTFSECAKYYRYVIYGTTGNGYTTSFKVWLYARRE